MIISIGSFDTVRHTVINQSSNSLVGKELISMQKSLSSNDIFFLSTKNAGFYKVNTTDSINPAITLNANIRDIRQLIPVNNDTQVLAVDIVSDIVRLVTLDNSKPSKTLLCRNGQKDCCQANVTCFQSPALQLGHVIASPQNPYHLYFVNGAVVQELNLASEDPEPKDVFSLDNIPDESLLSFDEDRNALSLVSIHTLTLGTYYKYNLTTRAWINNKVSFSAPGLPKFLLQLPASNNLLTLDVNKNLKHVDVESNTTTNVCADLTADNVTFAVQRKACQRPSKYRAITVDEEYIYVLSANNHLSVLDYSCKSLILQ